MKFRSDRARIAIIGAAFRMPGVGSDGFWEALLAGKPDEARNSPCREPCQDNQARVVSPQSDRQTALYGNSASCQWIPALLESTPEGAKRNLANEIRRLRTALVEGLWMTKEHYLTEDRRVAW